MKSKTRGKLWAILGTLVMLLPFFVGLGSVTASAEETDTASVTLHKKKMTALPNPLVQNTGAEVDAFDAYEGLPDVKFTVYDVTAAYLEKAKAGDAEKAKTDVSDPAKLPAAEVKLVGSGTTDSNGDVTFDLPKKNDSGEYAVYVFVETSQDGVESASNMVLSFPVYQMNADGTYTDTELSEIHLYPKNVVSNNGQVTIKKVGTDEKLLTGAKFTLQYTGTIAAYKNKFATGELSNSGYAVFQDTAVELETENGLLTVSGLPDGSYTLTETNPATGYSKDGQKDTFVFEIKGGEYQGDNLLYDVTGYDYGNPADKEEPGYNHDLTNTENPANLVIENLLDTGNFNFIKQDVNTQKKLEDAEFAVVKTAANDSVKLMKKTSNLAKGEYQYAWSDEVSGAEWEKVTLNFNQIQVNTLSQV